MDWAYWELGDLCKGYTGRTGSGEWRVMVLLELRVRDTRYTGSTGSDRCQYPAAEE